MTTIRRHLRLVATAWLFFQVASLSVLVQRDCCAAHQPAATKATPTCHETVAAGHCPMPAADGTPCPMHRGGDSADQPSNTHCSMRGTCDGPIAALFALLSNHGVLTERFDVLPDLHATAAIPFTRENLIGRLASPDPPPPRA